jgi:hypothetical protein
MRTSSVLFFPLLCLGLVGCGRQRPTASTPLDISSQATEPSQAAASAPARPYPSEAWVIGNGA